MNGLKELLEIEKNRLIRIKSVVDNRLIEVPEGVLRISTSNNCTQFKQSMESMNGYFKKVDGDIFFFTREMADEYIAEAAKLCLKELNAFMNGEKLLESYDNAWDNRTYLAL